MQLKKYPHEAGHLSLTLTEKYYYLILLLSTT